MRYCSATAAAASRPVSLSPLQQKTAAETQPIACGASWRPAGSIIRVLGSWRRPAAFARTQDEVQRHSCKDMAAAASSQRAGGAVAANLRVQRSHT